MSAQPSLNQVVRTKGEPYVWFCSMGLALGLLMVVGLLGLIISQGVSVFWPRQVFVFNLRPGVANGVNDRPVIGGEIVKEQTRKPRAGEKAGGSEWQIFTGNRDAYGFSFKYVAASDLVKAELPRDVFVFERMEYGKAIAYPLAIEGGGTTTLRTDAGFGARLAGAVRAAADRRKEIEHIEKGEIGDISATMQKLKDRRARIGEAEVDAQLAELQKRYEVLAAKASALRAAQMGDTLKYRLVTGEERSLAVGQIIDFYQPNTLGFFGKFGRFSANVWSFLSEDPREANTEGGIFPAIFGTFVMTLLMSMVVMPFGIVAAIYLREYATQGLWVRVVRVAVNNLAGVPSIVFGVFGLGFFVYLLGSGVDDLFFKDRLPTPTFGTGGIMWAALTLALMTVPVIIVATEEALAAVPRGAREASLALGASKWQTIQRVVLPASSSGILTGLILAMARGAGEVAPLMLVGVVKLAPSLPLDGAFPFMHLDRKFMHLGFHIYDLGFQSPDSEAAKPMVFATTLFLIVLVVVLNLSAILVRERLRRKYATGAF